MSFTPLPLTGFVRGLVANTGRLASPRGSVRRISNLYYGNQGSLTTIDGSLIQSQNNAPPATSVISAVMGNPIVGGDPWLALLVNTSTPGTTLYSINSNTWTSLGSISGQGATMPPPTMIPFNQRAIVVVNNLTVPRLWNGTTFTALTNAWTASGYAPNWTASTAEAVGNIIIAATNIWKCIQAGTTGTVAPTWPASGTVTDNSVIWQFVGSATPGTPNGAFASVAAGCLFLWGTGSTYSTYDGPDSFRQSDVLNPNSWNPVNQVFVGGKDGQTAQGLANFTIGAAGLAAAPRQVLFKQFSSFEFLGLFPNFLLTQAKTDLGCIAPRSIQFIADLHGVIRLTHKGFALYTGAEAGADRIISDEIRPYLFGGASDVTAAYMPTQDILANQFNYIQGCLSAQSLNPRMYVCAVPLLGGTGQLTRVFMLDVDLTVAGGKPVWSIADLPWAITSLDTIESGPYFFGSGRSLVVMSPAAGAPWQTDGTMRRWFAGDPDWDGTPISWSFKTPQLFDPRKPQSVFYDRKVSIGGTGTGKVTGLSLDYNNPASGTERTKTIPLPSAGVGIPVSKPIDQLNRGGALTISGTGPVVIEAVDVEVQPRGERPYAQS